MENGEYDGIINNDLENGGDDGIIINNNLENIGDDGIINNNDLENGEDDGIINNNDLENALGDLQKTDEIIDYAIEYCISKGYPPGLSKDKKRAVRKRAKVISVVDGEVYIQRRTNKVCIM